MKGNQNNVVVPLYYGSFNLLYVIYHFEENTFPHSNDSDGISKKFTQVTVQSIVYVVTKNILNNNIANCD